MKKNTIAKIITIILALTFIFAISVNVYAADKNIYGSTSGSCENKYKSDPYIVYLPKGTIVVDYTLSGTNNMQLRFYKRSSLSHMEDYVQLVEGSRTSSIDVPESTTYYIYLWSNNNIPKTFSYSYTLY